ncbi:MAG TPA: nucleotidyl transferase AbiEii/AbiGii toxin family protein [Thermodesulfovibrionia bacterium]|nr:nucleotidyl transferase AbiEii/AbiGii toxin family protein [Thermodesulfovibrionia bacterium]
MYGEKELHFNILTDRQKKVFDKLAEALSDTDFYLAGGTAIALLTGHRQSVDFDWFCQKLGEPEKLFHRLKRFDIDFTVQSVDLETVYLIIDMVQVSFIGYNYDMLQPYVFLQENRIKLAGTDDIACMKLSAIASRGARKDFIDLYFLINIFRSLEDYLQLYMKKYRNRDIGHVIRSLVYFDDAEAEPEVKVIKPFNWEKMKKDFEKRVEGLLIQYP